MYTRFLDGIWIVEETCMLSTVLEVSCRVVSVFCEVRSGRTILESRYTIYLERLER